MPPTPVNSPCPIPRYEGSPFSLPDSLALHLPLDADTDELGFAFACESQGALEDQLRTARRRFQQSLLVARSWELHIMQLEYKVTTSAQKLDVIEHAVKSRCGTSPTLIARRPSDTQGMFYNDYSEPLTDWVYNKASGSMHLLRILVLPSRRSIAGKQALRLHVVDH